MHNGSEAGRLKFAWQCAMSDGIPRRSFFAALVVGTVLNLINQGDALFGTMAVNWFKITLTYFVPYAVSTYDAASVRIRQVASAERI
ncbi:hypothetical protein M2427_004445 [Bradyrhizobium sp. BR13661]|jgi:hypothetical protein|nr:hypothetical protein [Bradyrhizobium sp. BR13661]